MKPENSAGVLWGIALSCCWLCNSADAGQFKSSIAIGHAISFPHYPVVLKGSDVPPLSGVATDQISLLAVKSKRLQPMPFQIDIKDADGQFVFVAEGNNIVTPFDDNDEIVFLADAAGEKWDGEVLLEPGAFITELKLEDPVSGEKKWVYLKSYSHGKAPQQSSVDKIHYDKAEDSIWSEHYRIHFRKQIPFLVDSFRWSSAKTQNCCPDIIDTMKVRHTGKLFGMFDFERTQLDYDSKLLAVKAGPVRVIRRTENNVHILFGLHSPIILIDFIAYPNAIFMDTHLNLPFRLGLVFSDLKTYTTVDLDSSTALPRATIYSESTLSGSVINGVIDEPDKRLNESADEWLTLNSEFGTLMTGLALDPGMAVTKRVYMLDDKTQEDATGEIQGLFGNIGYLTQNWEAVEGGIHHMLFGIYVSEKIEPKKSFEILIDAPWPM